MTVSPDFINRVAFAVGTGRCGTKFIQRVLACEPGVAALHERNRLNEAFCRYCQWYQLLVDNEGFLYTKEMEIRQDLINNNFSFEASAYLSLSIKDLYERFNAKFILLIRRPDQVVNSLWSKGWYKTPYIQADSTKALGYQQQPEDHHFFSRIAPLGLDFEEWNKMSRVGKIAWFWSTINKAVIEQFSIVPESHWRVVKLEELSYFTYQNLTRFLGIESKMTESEYQRIAKQRPNQRQRIYTTSDWSPREIAEFETQVCSIADYFGYKCHVNNLPPVSRSRIVNDSSHYMNFLSLIGSKVYRRATRALRIIANDS